MRTLIAAIVILIASAAGVLGHTRLKEREVAMQTRLQAVTDERNQAQERAKRDRQVLVARQAKIASEARKLAAENRGLQEALQRNKPWSDTDVPPEVQEALVGPGRGLPEPSDVPVSDSVRE